MKRQHPKSVISLIGWIVLGIVAGCFGGALIGGSVSHFANPSTSGGKETIWIFAAIGMLIGGAAGAYGGSVRRIMFSGLCGVIAGFLLLGFVGGIFRFVELATELGPLIGLMLGLVYGYWLTQARRPPGSPSANLLGRPDTDVSEREEILEMLGPPSANLPQFRTKVRDRGDTLELSGAWLDDIFPGKSKIEVMKRGDLKAFFAGAERKLSWAVAYMHHPDPDMLAQVFEAAGPFDQVATIDVLACLVTHGDTKIEEVAIRSLWPALEESAFPVFFTVLGSSGAMPSGIDRARARTAVQRIYAECPSQCSASKKQQFEELAKDRFGPTVLQCCAS